jgi:hypothetical protein
MFRWQEKNPALKCFEELVAMYISDCMQYLDVARTFKKPNLVNEKFEITSDQDLIYYGLRQLKDECMRLAGEDPLNWQDSKG